MKIALFVLFVTTGLFAQNFFQHERLTKIWETDSIFKVPESVFHDEENDVLYVANINGNPTEKNEKGFISKMSLRGELLHYYWIVGLNAPKGMGKHKNKLYVTDIDRVAEIDLKENTIVKYYPAQEAQFLNDIAVDKKGKVYVSDMKTNKIYRLSKGKLEVWLESEELKSPNGLYYDGKSLLVGIKGSVLKVNLKNKKISTYIENTGGIDGLESIGTDGYIISDWSGHVNLVYPNKEKLEILDTTPVEKNAADIDFIIKKQMLLVPTFYDNRVTAYRLK